MHCNPIYSLHYIAGAPYLLPHGQGIADHRRGIRLNETGVFLWNRLQQETDRQALLKAFYTQYGAEPEDYARLEQDLDTFLNQLSAIGILQKSPEPEACARPEPFALQIGPLQIWLDAPLSAIPPEFLPFQSSQKSTPALAVSLKTGLPDIKEHPAPLIRHEQLCVYEITNYFLLEFPQTAQLSCALLKKDGSCADLYHTPPYTSAFKTGFFHALRMLFLYTAQLHGCYALHSASILYRGKAWLFSGHSGMGKSTHTNLWRELYNVKILNGDLNLLSLVDGKPVIYGMPWCGTSQISDAGEYALGGIILLGRSSREECLELSNEEQILLCAQRLISPAWTEGLLRKNLDFMSSLVGGISVCMLKCTKEPTAAAAAKEWVDLQI